MKRGMYLAAALCLLLCGCGKKDAAEAQAVEQVALIHIWRCRRRERGRFWRWGEHVAKKSKTMLTKKRGVGEGVGGEVG